MATDFMFWFAPEEGLPTSSTFRPEEVRRGDSHRRGSEYITISPAQILEPNRMSLPTSTTRMAVGYRAR